jgi:PST family polysaccharide transporter
MSEPSESQVNTKEHPDLYRRSIKGGYWAIALRAAILILGYAKVFIVANFFILENLGIIVIAMMIMDILSMVSQTGFEVALVHKKENIRAYLNTAWTAGLVKGIALFLILFFLAPLAASIRVPDDKVAIATAVLRAMSFCFLIRGVQNIGVIFFQKDMEFKKIFTLNLASSLSDIILSVAFIYIFKSIWGVISARIVSEAVYCAGSYLLSPYRPKFHFELTKARNLWKFGKWVFGQNIFAYLLENGDDFFVWFFLGVPQLVLYRYAYNFSYMPAKHISEVIATVSFPAYAKIQDDIPRLRDAYLKILRVTAFIVVPVSLMLFVLGPEMIRLFLKEQFHPMVTVFQILAINGLIGSLGKTRGSLFNAAGRPDLSWRFHWMRLLVLVVLIYPFTRLWGIEGTALCVLALPILIDPVSYYYVADILQCSVTRFLGAVFIPFAASTLMYSAVRLQKTFIFQGDSYLFFAGNALVSIAAYLVSAWFLDKIFSSGLFRDIIELYRGGWSRNTV